MKDWTQPAPTQARFRVEYVPGKGHAVFDPDGRMTHDPGSLADARCACQTLQAAWNAKRKIGERPCLCCGTPFESEGIHNRLCTRCRTRDDALASYGYLGASDGRKPRRSSGA
ncbi:hypothetical protein [Nioella sp.]|uniref:hypothetical protein n=1 Tax=Nioella sp. TaxID=1912091 RepID=UPI003512A4E5